MSLRDSGSGLDGGDSDTEDSPSPRNVTGGGSDRTVALSSGVISFLITFARSPLQTLGDLIFIPLLNATFGAGIALVDGILFVLFGGDRAVGISDGTVVGIVDIPVLLARPVVTAFNAVSDVFIGAISPVIQWLALQASAFGIAAPIAVNFMWAVLVSAILWIIYTVIQTIDIPFVRLREAGRAAARPFLNAFRWLIG